MVEHVEPVDAAIGNDPFEAVRLRRQDETVPENQSCSAEPLAIIHTITPRDPPFSERTPFQRPRWPLQFQWDLGLPGLCRLQFDRVDAQRQRSARRCLDPRLFDIGQTNISCFLYISSCSASSGCIPKQKGHRWIAMFNIWRRLWSVPITVSSILPEDGPVKSAAASWRGSTSGSICALLMDSCGGNRARLLCTRVSQTVEAFGLRP